MFYLLQSGLLQKLDEWDKWLFLKVNNGMSNPFFDNLMPFMRNGMNWAPLYLFLGIFAIINFRSRGAWWSLFFVATVALADLGGNNLFKQNFHRPRPCLAPDLALQVRLLINQCTGGSSFISNHAANHFAMATFFFITFRDVLPKWAWIGFAWAALIAFAQVYVGIHYPFDVLAGALFGLLVGLLTGRLFNKRYRIAIFDHQPEA